MKKIIKNPLVTVYITNHNYQDYIDTSIRSVLNQTFKNFELIIIDDGSIDNSKEIIDKYAHHDNVFIVYQENKGLNISNNIALKLSRGKYIIRLDADDYFDENALQIMSCTLENNKDIGMVFPDYFIVDKFEAVQEVMHRHNFDNVEILDQPAHGAGTMIRTKCLKNLGGYDEEFSCQDGYDLWIRFIQKYKVKNINLPLFYYRKHNSNLTNNEDKILETRARILEKTSSKFKEKKQIAIIIPIRGKKLDPHSIALRELGGVRVLDWTIQSCLRLKKEVNIIVTSSDKDVLKYTKETYQDRVIVIERSYKLATLNSHLGDTISYVLNQYKKLGYKDPESIAQLSIESPFRKSRHIDSALDVLNLFDVDSVVSVIPENSMLYHHDEQHLKPLSSKKFLRLESNEIYREAGNMHIFSAEFFKKTGRIVGGKMGHIIIEEKYGIDVDSEWKWQMCLLLDNSH
jgi:CMP-N-acetylneuraminic acid synthetase